MLIFGSRAAKHWYPDFREPKRDTDYISKLKEKTRFVEHHWIDSFQYVLERNSHPVFVDPDFLYTIKVSHAAWDIHWDKTMLDIKFFKSKGCKLDYVLLDMLYDEWCKIHGNKKVNLNKYNEEFFTDAVDRKYNHDQLHEHFKFYNEPLHTKIRQDLSKAFPSKKMFFSLKVEEQFKCALEEIYVVATERYILPKGMPLKHAKYKAMKQLITSMTKGWFNLFLIEQFDELYYNDLDKVHFEPKVKELLNESHQKEN